jgi:hypothetical protein
VRPKRERERESEVVRGEVAEAEAAWWTSAARAARWAAETRAADGRRRRREREGERGDGGVVGAGKQSSAPSSESRVSARVGWRRGRGREEEEEEEEEEDVTDSDAYDSSMWRPSRRRSADGRQSGARRRCQTFIML